VDNAWRFAEASVHWLYDALEQLAGNTFASVRPRVARHLLDLAPAQSAAAPTVPGARYGRSRRLAHRPVVVGLRSGAKSLHRAGATRSSFGSARLPE
jgi:hypothetical protein